MLAASGEKQEADPSMLTFPDSQVWHVLAEVAPVVPLYVPAGHGAHDPDEEEEYLPSLQSSQPPLELGS